MMPQDHRTFPWQDCAEELAAFADDPAFQLDAKGRCFASESLRVLPPLVFPIPASCTSISEYLADLPDEPGAHAVILLQAGAVALGRFEAGEPVVTKSFKKYVVRGHGRAQPLHLATKGKSRYGSRLRLQNARRQLEETIERLMEWEEEFGPPDEVYYNAPVRLWASLFGSKPEPPFERQAAIRIPRDLPKPNTEILLRTYRGLGYGRIEQI